MNQIYVQRKASTEGRISKKENKYPDCDILGDLHHIKCERKLLLIWTKYFPNPKKNLQPEISCLRVFTCVLELNQFKGDSIKTFRFLSLPPIMHYQLDFKNVEFPTQLICDYAKQLQLEAPKMSKNCLFQAPEKGKGKSVWLFKVA